MNDETCGTCRHRVLSPIDPLNVTAPRQGACRRRPPSVTILPQSKGLLHLHAYPPVAEDYPACGDWTPVAVNGATDPEKVTAWWDETLRNVLDASARGETFLVDCLMQDLDKRLRQADELERRALLESLVGLVAIADKARAEAPA